MRYVIETPDRSPLKNEQGKRHVFTSLAEAKAWAMPGERVRPAERGTQISPVES